MPTNGFGKDDRRPLFVDESFLPSDRSAGWLYPSANEAIRTRQTFSWNFCMPTELGFLTRRHHRAAGLGNFMDAHTSTPEAAKSGSGNRFGNDLSGILHALVENSDGDQVTIGTLLDAFGRKTFGPMLLIPAIIAVAPTGAIPGMSIITGTMILLVCLQMLMGREQVWLPERITSFSFSRNALKPTVDRALPWARWLEQFVGRRMTLLSASPFDHAVALTCAALALSMYPLALVPFAVAIPGIAIGLFALGLMLSDGALIFAGYVLAAAAGYAVFTFV